MLGSAAGSQCIICCHTFLMDVVCVIEFFLLLHVCSPNPIIMPMSNPTSKVRISDTTCTCITHSDPSFQQSWLLVMYATVVLVFITTCPLLLV